MTDPVTRTAEVADRLPAVLRWSIADAWAWFGHAWTRFIHVPYLGVVALLLALVVALRAVGKVLR